MNPNLQERVRALSLARLSEDDKLDGYQALYFNTLALCGEVGELANLVKKLWRGDVDPDMRRKIRGELADVLMCAFIVTDLLNEDVDCVVATKLFELRQRWPESAAKLDTLLEDNVEADLYRAHSLPWKCPDGAAV